MSPEIQTSSGSWYNFQEPEKVDIEIVDIAAALSRICRFNGQLRDEIDIYTVAQHSVECSYLVPDEYAFQALMHDAHEAYVGDVTSPFKQLLNDYKHYEKLAEAAVHKRFGLPMQLHPCVKEADMIMLATEQRDFQLNPDPGLEGIQPLARKLSAWSVRKSKQAFIERFIYLTGRHRAAAA